MLGKLYISADSTTEKLQIANELVIEAIDTKIAGDAASRTALNKLHLALSKAMGEAGKTRKNVEEIVSPPGEEDLTAVEEQDESVLAEDEDVKMEPVEDEAVTDTRDSILDDLLDDDDEDV